MALQPPCDISPPWSFLTFSSCGYFDREGRSNFRSRFSNLHRSTPDLSPCEMNMHGMIMCAQFEATAGRRGHWGQEEEKWLRLIFLILCNPPESVLPGWLLENVPHILPHRITVTDSRKVFLSRLLRAVHRCQHPCIGTHNMPVWLQTGKHSMTGCHYNATNAKVWTKSGSSINLVMTWRKWSVGLFCWRI